MPHQNESEILNDMGAATLFFYDVVAYTLTQQLLFNNTPAGKEIYINNITYMRCDGMVEYSYKINGIWVYEPDASWHIS
ncbi:MAG: hypothetical protein VB035_08650 [Candidatus Fimivivens sp.]|nr:hypothetical protein [Candidatus Fimivivens sp.]